jgi:nucleoid DNA-binding protein
MITMTKTDMSIALAAETGFTKTTCYEALTAMEQQLDAESMALRAVVWDKFGTFLPRHIVGRRTGRMLDGGIITYDNWKLVPDPQRVSQASFVAGVAKRMGQETEDVQALLQSYKKLVISALRKGRSVTNNTLGSFKVSRRKARTYYNEDGSLSSKKPARLVVVFKSCKTGLHQKFVADSSLLSR